MSAEQLARVQARQQEGLLKVKAIVHDSDGEGDDDGPGESSYEDNDVKGGGNHIRVHGCVGA